MNWTKRILLAALETADRLRHRARRRREAPHMALARRGEDLAHRFAQRDLGWTIVSRNFRDHTGRLEIDLVAVDQGALVIAEVKTRSSDAASSPLRAVHPEKGKRLGMASRNWIRRAEALQMPLRFDAITVIVEPGGAPPRLEHHRDLFYLPAREPL